MAPISGGLGSTLTAGLQDIAALLPLLGTEQCEEHIGSALSNGYLYAAATPLSIFGSLGMARAGFKAFLASLAIPRLGFVGARTLANMGFKPQGRNLSLITIDEQDEDGRDFGARGFKGDQDRHRHLVETRLDQLLKELQIDVENIAVSYHCIKWNAAMMLHTAIFSVVSVVPYIYLNIDAGSRLPDLTRWSFPVIRATGGFLTATITQLVIQRRIKILANKRLQECKNGKTSHVALGDPEEAQGLPPTDGNSPLTWLILALLLLGILATVAGYVGCFMVVQSAQKSAGPVSWLCLEAGLSVIRIIFWGYNHDGDDAPPLHLVLTFDVYPPLVTCNKYVEHIMEDKVLPLMRASPFLNSITAFAGLLERFDDPNFTLYYTLTRKRGSDLSSRNVTATGESSTSQQPETMGERVLYITIFDHKERTTRIYTQDTTGDHFYSTESEVPVIDLPHGLLETKFGEEINPKDDPIASDANIRFQLSRHYRSIMDQIHCTIAEAHQSHEYIIENAWTMKVSETISTRETLRTSQQGPRATAWTSAVEKGKAMELNIAHPSSVLDRHYLEGGWLEKKQRQPDYRRGEWITSYLQYVLDWTTRKINHDKALKPLDGNTVDDDIWDGWDGMQQGTTEEDGSTTGSDLLDVLDTDPDAKEAEVLFIDEHCHMELLLVYEVERWEEMIWERSKDVLEMLGSDRVLEKERCMRERRGNSWRRFDTHIRAMEARIDAAKAMLGTKTSDELWTRIHDTIPAAWQSLIGRFVDGGSTSSHFSRLDRLNDNLTKREKEMRWRFDSRRCKLDENQQERCWRLRKEMETRLRRELEDIEYRLERGLDHCDQFGIDQSLFWCRHDGHKYLWLEKQNLTAPLDFYARALKGNNDVVHIGFFGFVSDDDYTWVSDTIHDLPFVTSILVPDPQRLAAIQRNRPLFIDDVHHLTELAEFIESSQSQLTSTRDTLIFLVDRHGKSDSTIAAISFFGPPSGTLTLRLTHRSERGKTILALDLGPYMYMFSILSSLIVNDITIHSDPGASLSFQPDTHNNLIIRVIDNSEYYMWEDIQLLAEGGNPYNPVGLNTH